MDSNAESAAARKRGNGFYRKRQFAEAEKAYEQAASLDPSDSAPWSNLSAVKFGLGDYGASLKSLQKAASLSSNEPDDGPKKQKLYTRVVKCYLLTLDLENAENAAQHLIQDASGNNLRLAIKETRDLLAANPDRTALRKQILDHVPRYKGHLQDMPEYYAVGHDTRGPLIDEDLLAAAAPRGDLAVLLCGSGDARHLFTSIIELFNLTMVGKKNFSMAHFTLVDLNTAALARTLVMFDFLIAYVSMRAQKMPRVEDGLTVLAYVYTSPFIPPFALSKIVESVNKLVSTFEDESHLPGSTVMGAAYVPKETREEVLRKLQQWQSPLQEKFSPGALRKRNVENGWRRGSRGDDHVTPGTEKDREDYEKLCVTFPNDTFLQRRESELLPLLNAYRLGQDGAQDALEAHIDTYWQTNPTMLDLDWEPRRQEEVPPNAPDYEFLPVLDAYPARILQDLGGFHGQGGVLSGLEQCFDIVAISMLQFFEKVWIEVIVGEMADVLERMRHNLHDYRFQKTKKDAKNLDPLTSPKVYDRIHMSNIPDYIGGPLAAHLYGGPLLRRDRRSNLRFNNLLNPPMFDDHEHFQAEYMLMHDNHQIVDHFGLVRETDSLDMEKSAMQEAMCRQLGISSFAVEDYWIWSRHGANRIPRNKMMSASALEHWLHGHLLQICVPSRRPLFSDRPVHAPLNLTMLFRLVCHLHEVGYPAHMLSNILAGICEGSITTTARFPRRLVLKPTDVDKRHPSRKISLGPWKTEFTTLLSIWRGLLSFGVATPERAFVPLDQIVQCRIGWAYFHHTQKRVPHFALIFMKEDPGKNYQFPSLIQDDEAGDNSEHAKWVREEGIHIVTAFRFQTVGNYGYFWMRRDVADEIMSHATWIAYICRTDTWELIRDTWTILNESMKILES